MVNPMERLYEVVKRRYYGRTYTSGQTGNYFVITGFHGGYNEVDIMFLVDFKQSPTISDVTDFYQHYKDIKIEAKKYFNLDVYITTHSECDLIKHFPERYKNRMRYR